MLRGLDFCYAQIDDILVASKSVEEHLRHLEMLFKRLQGYDVVDTPPNATLGKLPSSSLDTSSAAMVIDRYRRKPKPF